MKKIRGPRRIIINGQLRQIKVVYCIAASIYMLLLVDMSKINNKGEYMSKVIEYLDTMLLEKKWSGEVETEWKPKEGFFKQSAEKIAAGLKRNSKDLKQASSRLNFYKNRAGKNLDAKDKARLELAKEKLHTLYECVNESKTITTSSGIKGWQDKLKKVYSSLEEFKKYCDTYNIHTRLGFKTPEEAWKANPTIQGSTNPKDLKIVK